MENDNTATADRDGASTATRVSELVRPRDGRMIAGVAQGLAERYEVSVVLVRLTFVLLTIAGGLGVALYAAGWFLIRADDEAHSPAERVFSGETTVRSWVGIGLVFIAALILLDNFTFFSGGIVFTVALLVVGILLYTGNFPRTGSQAEIVSPSDDDTDNVQESTSTDPVAPTLAAPTDRDAPVDSGPPPTPTPTPPILPPPAPKPRESSLLGRITIGVMLVGLGVLAILDNIPGLAIEPEPRHYMALAVTIVGLGLIVGGFVGRARWLILLGALMVPTLLFSPVFEYDWSEDTFSIDETPTSFAQLEDSYQLDVGRVELDLRELPWAGETVSLEVIVDAGDIRVIVPEGLGLVGRASVDVGQVTVLDQVSAGLGDRGVSFEESGTLGTLELTANADVGNISVVNG